MNLAQITVYIKEKGFADIFRNYERHDVINYGIRVCLSLTSEEYYYFHYDNIAAKPITGLVSGKFSFERFESEFAINFELFKQQVIVLSENNKRKNKCFYCDNKLSDIEEIDNEIYAENEKLCDKCLKEIQSAEFVFSHKNLVKLFTEAFEINKIDNIYATMFAEIITYKEIELVYSQKYYEIICEALLKDYKINTLKIGLSKLINVTFIKVSKSEMNNEDKQENGKITIIFDWIDNVDLVSSNTYPDEQTKLRKGVFVYKIKR